MEAILMMALILLGAHWLCDYPLQGQFLSDAKVKGPLRFYHLVAHAGIQGAAVALVTGSVWLGLAEWLAHTIIDEMKVRGHTSFAQDQALHLQCKFLWLLLLFC
jgi:ABC-type transport system involved in cytochrome c biogenesis permease subunit